MKKIKNILIALVALLGIAGLASCGNDSKGPEGTVDMSKTSYKIGILQYLTHGALDKATEGFKQEILSNLPAGKTVEFVERNPEADSALMDTMADYLVNNCDLVMGNATPAAVSLKNAAYNAGKKQMPVLFTSVSDPVDAKLVKTNAKPGKYVTGTSDINPIVDQIKLIGEFDSSITKVGFLYTISEVNSRAQVTVAEKSAKTAGYTTMIANNNDASDISSAVNRLISGGCKAIYIPTDNILAKNMTVVNNITEAANVIVICGEEGMVTAGGTLTLSIDYTKLGTITGSMAVEVLNGGNTATMAVRTQTDGFVFAYNQTSLTNMGKSLPSAIISKYNVE